MPLFSGVFMYMALVKNLVYGIMDNMVISNCLYFQVYLCTWPLFKALSMI